MLTQKKGVIFVAEEANKTVETYFKEQLALLFEQASKHGIQFADAVIINQLLLNELSEQRQARLFKSLGLGVAELPNAQVKPDETNISPKTNKPVIATQSAPVVETPRNRFEDEPEELEDEVLTEMAGEPEKTIVGQRIDKWKQNRKVKT